MGLLPIRDSVLNTPSNPTITVATANWGGYWEKYGSRWTEAILQLDPAPTRVIVASDVPIQTDFEVVICEIKSLGPMRNAAIDFTDTEWFVPSDLDDLPLPNYIKDLKQDTEIHAFSYRYGGMSHGYKPTLWENAFSIECPNPIGSCSAYKTDWAKRVRYRDIGWEDWAFWLDMKKAGARAHYDETVRWIYTRPPNSLSQQDVDRKENEIFTLKRAGW